MNLYSAGILNVYPVRLAVIAIIGLFIAPTAAWSGGLEVPDLGTVALGRGFSFVAKADNASAFYYNPAGLSKRKGRHLLIGSNLINPKFSFLRSGRDPSLVDLENPDDPSLDYAGGEANPTPYKAVSSANQLGPVPSVIFNWCGIGPLDGMALSIGIITPSSFGRSSYPQSGPQRYALRETNMLLVYPGIGISYAFNRYIQVGAVFLNGIAILEQSQAIRPLIQQNDWDRNEDTSRDADLKLNATDYFMPSGIIGVLSNPIDWLEIGVSVRLPVKVSAKGNLTYTPPEADFQESFLSENEVSLEQSFPWVVRTGVRYIHEMFDIEADFIWEEWSSVEAFAIELDAKLMNDAQDMNGTTMPNAKVPKNFRDTYSVRLGSDVEVWPEHITVRVGGFWQSSAYPKNNETFSVDFPYSTQFGVGGGLTWHAVEWLDVNAGYMHIFQPDVIVKDGIMQQQGPPFEMDPSDPEAPTYDLGNTVNNGTYKVSINTFGLSLEGHF